MPSYATQCQQLIKTTGHCLGDPAGEDAGDDDDEEG